MDSDEFITSYHMAKLLWKSDYIQKSIPQSVSIVEQSSAWHVMVRNAYSSAFNQLIVLSRKIISELKIRDTIYTDLPFKAYLFKPTGGVKFKLSNSY